jgi:hypothetical protein
MKIRPSTNGSPGCAPDSATEHLVAAGNSASAAPPLPSAPEEVAELRRALAVSEGRLIIALQQNSALRREHARVRQELTRLAGKTERARVLRFARLH